MLGDDFRELLRSSDPIGGAMGVAQNYRKEMPVYMHVLTTMVRERMVPDPDGLAAKMKNLQASHEAGEPNAIGAGLQIIMQGMDMQMYSRLSGILLSTDAEQQERDALAWIAEMEAEENE